MAKQAGVQQADVILQRGRSLSLQAQGAKLDKTTKVTSTQVICIRVIQDQRVGMAASEASDADSLQLLVKQALGSSRYASVDSDQRIEQKNSAGIIEYESDRNQPDDASLEAKVDLAL
ncbi:MAG: PmbA/TldA family metallopeptidase [Oligoflexus sp.]